MISKRTYHFLTELKNNNNRDWFQANKELYDEAKADFEEFLAKLVPAIAKFDKSVANLEPKKCIFRIYRDTRFSKDKTPYKTNLGAHLSSGGKMTDHNLAGYYIHLEPGNSFLGGGAYLPPASWLKAIRQEIDYNAKDLKKIIGSKSFKKYFGKIEGEKLKTAPKGYPKDHPEIDLLKFKSLVAVHNFSDKQALSDSFPEYSVQVFKALEPFNRFMNRGAS